MISKQIALQIMKWVDCPKLGCEYDGDASVKTLREEYQNNNV